jgi:hypothetical protein
MTWPPRDDSRISELSLLAGPDVKSGPRESLLDGGAEVSVGVRNRQVLATGTFRVGCDEHAVDERS